MARRLRGGKLFAAACSANWFDDDNQRYCQRGITSIDPSWWRGLVDGLGALLETGDASFAVPDPSGIGAASVDFFDIRFEWSGVDAIAPRETLPAAVAPDQNHIAAGEHVQWYKPAEALALLPRSWGSESGIRALAERISDGLIRVAAAEARALDKEDQFLLLPKAAFEKWGFLADPQFWNAGDFHHFIRDRTGYAGYREYELRAYDVRLERIAVDHLVQIHSASQPVEKSGNDAGALAAALGNAQAAPSGPERLGTVAEAIDRKPVSPATLRAWWEFCRSIKPADAWTMDDLRDFFVQCLPDKSVSRDQLREVRGRQKSGPKRTAAE